MRPDAFLTSDALLGVAIGLGLAAAAGFRVFVPLLAAALAAKTGVLELSPGFAWLATTPAIAALAIATVYRGTGAYSAANSYLDGVGAVGRSAGLAISSLQMANVAEQGIGALASEMMASRAGMVRISLDLPSATPSHASAHYGALVLPTGAHLAR